MTFKIRNWLGDPSLALPIAIVRPPASVRRRPSLVGRWQVGADGKLERRWLSLPDESSH